MAQTAFKGAPVSTVGALPGVGRPAPAFVLTTAKLEDFSLASTTGKTLVLNVFPSIDTPVCAASVRRFNAEAAALGNTTVLCISADLPFAQARFCAAEGLKGVVTLSAFRSDFGRDYGLAIAAGPLRGLLARAVLIVDPKGTVRYAALSPEIAQEPDYAAALAAVSAL